MPSTPLATDYSEAVLNPRFCFNDPRLNTCTVEQNQFGLPRSRAGGFAITFKLMGHNTNWAVRCFSRQVPDREQRYAAINSHLRRLSAPFLVSTEYLKTGILVKGVRHPITMMEWVSGETLESYIHNNFTDESRMQQLQTAFASLAADLERTGIAHGDLSHANIMVRNHKLVLVDYDGMYVPALAGKPACETGLPNFQHPRRTVQHFDGRMDRFSTIVIYLALRAITALPGIWRKYGPPYVEGLLFTREDFLHPLGSLLLEELDLLPDLRPLVQRFRLVCLGQYEQVPRLVDFLEGQSPKTRQDANDTVPIPSTNPYETLEARSLVAIQAHVGEMVTTVGKITSTRLATARNGKPYVFLDCGDWRNNCFRAVCWSDALDQFDAVGIKPDRDFQDRWVSVTGVVSIYKNRPQIVVDAPSQMRILANEAEALRLLAQPPMVDSASNQSAAAAPAQALTKPEIPVSSPPGRGEFFAEMQRLNDIFEPGRFSITLRDSIPKNIASGNVSGTSTGSHQPPPSSLLAPLQPPAPATPKIMSTQPVSPPQAVASAPQAPVQNGPNTPVNQPQTLHQGVNGQRYPNFWVGALLLIATLASVSIIISALSGNSPAPPDTPTATPTLSEGGTSVRGALIGPVDTATPTTAATPTSTVAPMSTGPVTGEPVLIYAIQDTALYSGPDRSFSVTGNAKPGEFYWVVAKNKDGTWYQLKTGEWAPESAISDVSRNLPVEELTPPAQVTATQPAIEEVEQPTSTETSVPEVVVSKFQVPVGTPAEVAHIVDGDTIDVLIDGATYRVRYILVDTPERDMPYYAEATAANSALVRGKTVYLVKDVSETDRYNRLLRYVYLADGTFVNEELVRQGYAQIATFPPDVAMEANIRDAQADAFANGRGLWAQAEDSASEQNASSDTPKEAGGDQCDPAYPDVCIPPISVAGDLDCGEVPQFARFRVLAPDPHGLVGRDKDGLGCEFN